MKTPFIILYSLLILLSAQTECNKNSPVSSTTEKSADMVDSAERRPHSELIIDTVKNFNPDTLRTPMELSLVKVDTTFFLHQIDSLTKHIEANPDDAKAYLARGDIKSWIKDYEGACSDWKKAVSLGLKEANSILEKFCR